MLFYFSNQYNSNVSQNKIELECGLVESANKSYPVLGLSPSVGVCHGFYYCSSFVSGQEFLSPYTFSKLINFLRHRVRFMADPPEVAMCV